MVNFEEHYMKWLHDAISKETNPRGRERLNKGLGYGSVEFLKQVWYPAIGNFNHLHAEWEVRDFHNGYRYLDFAYTPGGAKGGIEVQGYVSHARDIDVRRSKDLCMRHSLLALDGWTFLPIAFPSINDDPKQCQQLILSFVDRFVSTDVNKELPWAEAEAVRFARRLLRPITSNEVAIHLQCSERHARRVLHSLTDKEYLTEKTGQTRYRLYALNMR